MKLRFNPSLGQMVALTLLGAFIMASSFLVIACTHLNTGHGLRLFVVFSMSTVVFGGFISLKATSELKNGIINERWPQNKIALYRRIFTSALWQVFSIGIMILGCIMMFTEKRPNLIAWALFTLGQTLSRMPWAFRVTPSSRQPPSRWNNVQPIHSDNWGSR